MSTEGVGGQDWKLISFKVEGDVHVDYVTRQVGNIIIGLGMDADPREGVVRVYVPPERADEAFVIADMISKRISGLKSLGVDTYPVQDDEATWDYLRSLWEIISRE